MATRNSLVARKKVQRTGAIDTSDTALRSLLKPLNSTVDPAGIRQLSDQIERVIFHKQFSNA